MLYWKKVIADKGNFAQVHNYLSKYPGKAFATRPDWKGLHFVTKNGDYAILLKSGEVLINPEVIMDTDKTDWMLVEVTKRAIETLTNKGLL